jgi:hypothetical protein
MWKTLHLLRIWRQLYFKGLEGILHLKYRSS